MSEPKPGEIYRHFKGNLYQVIGVGLHTETEERLVIYQALYGSFSLFARPLESFLSAVDREKYPDAAQEYRFEKVSREALSGAPAPAAEPEQTEGDEDILHVTPERVRSVIEDSGLSRGSTRKEAVEEEGIPEEQKLLMEYLDIRDAAERAVLVRTHRAELTERILTSMAVAEDVEISGRTIDEKTDDLLRCLRAKAKYEGGRMRA